MFFSSDRILAGWCLNWLIVDLVLLLGIRGKRLLCVMGDHLIFISVLGRFWSSIILLIIIEQGR